MIRPAKIQDINEIMKIYAHARAYMSANGNPSQWGEDKPSRHQIEQDIAESSCFVIEEDGRMQGVFYYHIGPEPTYAVIYQGAWQDDEPYGVLHRIAAAPGGSGVLKAAVGFAAGQTPRIRIDTHEDNHKMQVLLERYGFCRCGLIRIEDGTERIAYSSMPAG
ncbi:MAG: GNAT family protein [Lachnospiraceae bacterium]|nr:GNAT family protein [Lachnospiraceae bacterium]MDY5742408.1 GNAT family protein [Lachnospiraceae bacterium]